MTRRFHLLFSRSKSMAQKIVERCLVLEDVANGLLQRVDIARTGRLHDLLSNQQYSKMKARLEKSYPDVPDCSKVTGFDIMVQNAQEIFDQTLTFYELFCDITEYVQQAHLVINTIPALTTTFKLDRAHAPLCSMMKLLADYLRLVSE
jgi:hypothetical protein